MDPDPGFSLSQVPGKTHLDPKPYCKGISKFKQEFGDAHWHPPRYTGQKK